MSIYLFLKDYIKLKLKKNKTKINKKKINKIKKM